MNVARLALALVLGFAVQENLVKPLSLEAQVYDFSRIEIDVQKLGGELTFKFFVLSERPQAEEKIPARLYRLTVFEPNDKRVLWGIETTNIESMTRLLGMESFQKALGKFGLKRAWLRSSN